MNHFWMNCYSIKGLIKAHWSQHYFFYWFQWAMNLSLLSQEYSRAETFLRREAPARSCTILTRKSRATVIRVPEFNYYAIVSVMHIIISLLFSTLSFQTSAAPVVRFIFNISQALWNAYFPVMRQIGKCTFSFSLQKMHLKKKSSLLFRPCNICF